MAGMRKKSLLGISCIHDRVVEAVFLETSSEGFRLAGRESAVMAEEDISPAVVSEYQNRAAQFQSRSLKWIHLCLRSTAFVKVLTLSDVPGEPGDRLGDTLSDRIQAEIPYRPDEIVLHKIIQNRQSDKKQEAVVIAGISKKILAEQIEQLKHFGIVPDHIMLSTEALRRLYQKQIFHANHSHACALLIQSFGGQMEILFFENDTLLQSRSFPQGQDETSNVSFVIQDSIATFRRQWRRLPARILILDDAVPEEASAAFFQTLDLPVERISAGNRRETGTPALLFAAADAYQCGDAVDFSLPETKLERKRGKQSQEMTKLLLSAAALTLAFFLLAFVQMSTTLGQMLWLHVQRESIAGSVKELKAMRQEARSAQDFYNKKSAPIRFLAALRKAVPDDLLLQTLQYDQKQGSALLEGIAPEQKLIDQFLHSLKQEPIFADISLEQVQGKREKQEGMSYWFAVRLSLNIKDRT